jgi:GntR family galactonate operon transcriptional repressor
MRGIHRHVVQTIGGAIVHGRYKPESLLPHESELAKEFKVSRTAVREAMKVLAAKGLIETRRKRGTLVRAEMQWNHFDPEIITWRLAVGFDDDFIRDLIELRQIAEPAAAKLAATRATLGDIAAIEGALHEMEKNRNDPAAYAAADFAFHISIFMASHNKLIASLSHSVGQMLEITLKLHQLFKGASAYTPEEDIAFHSAVLDRISRGEPELAAEAMSNVVAAAKRDLIHARRGHQKQLIDAQAQANRRKAS